MANITKRGKTFTFTVSLGFDGTGKRIRKTMTYTPPLGMTLKQAEREAERQAALFEERCRTGQILDTNTRFAEFVDIWLHDYAEKQLATKTLTRYKELLQRINAAFGNMKISAIQPHHLNAFYNNLREKGIRADIKYIPSKAAAELITGTGITRSALAEKCGVSISVLRSCVAGKNITAESADKIAAFYGRSKSELFTPQEDKGLSDKTIQHYHRLLSSIFTVAVQWQVIFSNPCDRVKPPKVRRTEAAYLDEVGAARLISALDGEPYQYAVMVQMFLFTGMRRAELLGIEWKDVDFDTDCIHIRRNSLYTAGKGIYEGDTKTESSNRVIKVPQNAMQLLKDFRKWQDNIKREMGTAWKGTNRLFTTKDGLPMHPDTITGWFHNFVRRKELPKISIHSLRHTNATLMIAGGVPIKTVASRLGHASVATTGIIYTHAIKSADEAAAITLNDILNPAGNNKKAKTV
ncbi:MAG: tyrosine-type recombinase/integrase [Ruminiclostridium sp.]